MRRAKSTPRPDPLGGPIAPLPDDAASALSALLDHLAAELAREYVELMERAAKKEEGSK